MKILVTGATGFIGNHVIQELLKYNHTVIASSANETKAASFSWFSSVEYLPFKMDTYDPSINYHTFFHKPDIMLHLAWEGLPNYKAAFHIERNLPQHLQFLTNIISNGLKDITITGTCFEYGMQEGLLTEDMAVMPANPYAVAKNELHKALQLLQAKAAFRLKWARLFYMYGRGQSPNSLLSQLDTALAKGDAVFNMSGGEQIRDYLPVETVAAYLVKIALQEAITGVINCCSGTPITVKELVQSYLQNIKKDITLNLGYYPYPDYEPMAFWGDDTKLKTIIQ